MSYAGVARRDSFEILCLEIFVVLIGLCARVVQVSVFLRVSALAGVRTRV